MGTRSDPELERMRNEARCHYIGEELPHFTSVLLWVGSVLVLCTRDLYGSDLNENRSKMDPLPCVRSLNPIAPPRFVAHATLLRLFARMAPNIQKVVSALVTSCANNQTTLAVLIRKRKQRIQNQYAILHVLKRRWNVMLQASLFSILLLSSKCHVRAPRSCRRLTRNDGWWHLVWTSYSDRRFKQTFRVSRGTF